MKYTIFLLLAAFVFVGGTASASAQGAMTKKEVKFPEMQKSPTDIAYMREGSRGPVTARVLYGRPFKNGRTIFGELVPYGKVWRTGADEASEITFYKDVMFGDKEVKAGSYALFTIPNEDSWVVILNSELHQWGAFTYDESKDVVRTSAKVESLADPVENLSIVFNDGNMIMAWDKTKAVVPIKAK
ncbi:MAG: DUF2911 domain-containing protein [Acidobacteria bacterium]|nr:DUF2911 domain-containing protein [Acidobacteriota bacterium]